MLITRIAPTPSGYLHAGNGVNFLLTYWLAAVGPSRLVLRIDDVDAQRSRPEYIDDIFCSLGALGIQVDEGPSDRADFLANHSQGSRLAEYRDAVAELRAGGVEVYACGCSRRELAGQSTSWAGHPCRAAGLRHQPGRTALRVAVPDLVTVPFGSDVVDLAAELGDFVIWRRDDLPAYQLASLVDDRRLGTNAVVRGRDLLASSAAQRWLAPALGADAFAAGAFHHHALLVGPGGQKLSKSAGSTSLRAMLAEPGGLARLRAAATEIGAGIGISPP